MSAGSTFVEPVEPDLRRELPRGSEADFSEAAVVANMHQAWRDLGNLLASMARPIDASNLEASLRRIRALLEMAEIGVRRMSGRCS